MLDSLDKDTGRVSEDLINEKIASMSCKAAVKGNHRLSEKEAEALIDAIPAMAVEENTNWNKRYRENMVRLKSGDLYEVARVVKGLMYRDRRRGLSNGERKMLHSAKHILISEVVLSKNLSYEEVERKLNTVLTESFV